MNHKSVSQGAPLLKVEHLATCVFNVGNEEVKQCNSLAFTAARRRPQENHCPPPLALLTLYQSNAADIFENKEYNKKCRQSPQSLGTGWC
eukprot:29653-Pelagococcus_subviridis.AAC.3